MKKPKLKPRVQTKNANLHTERGLGMLGTSIERDGWIGAITVANDGETFDGSARVEVGEFEDAIVIESDGTKPIIHRRTDIPNADDPRAVRLGIAANRIPQVDLAWNPAILAELAPEEIKGMFSDKELAEILKSEKEPKDAEPQIDKAEELMQKWGTESGQLWVIGNHRLLVGDSTNKADVGRLCAGKQAHLLWTDPPYSRNYQSRGEKGECAAIGTFEAILASVQRFTQDALAWYVKFPWYDALAAAPLLSPKHFVVWAKRGFGLGQGDFRPQHEILALWTGRHRNVSGRSRRGRRMGISSALPGSHASCSRDAARPNRSSPRFQYHRRTGGV